MNQLLIKQTCVLSLILGAMLGVITIIPFIGAFSFLTLMFVASSIVLIYMKKNNMIGKLIPKDGALLGSIIGFTSFIGFSISFIPLATIIGLFYKGSYYLGISMLFRIGFFVMIMMVVFVAMLSALMNAFSGLATVYIYSQMLNTEESNATFTIDN
jgi:hypothetical protein